MFHERLDQKFYWNRTLGKTPNRPILAIRQESLPRDLQDLEEYLRSVEQPPQHEGGATVNNFSINTNHPSSATQHRSTHFEPSRLVLNPVDSKHFLSGKVSSDLDGPGTDPPSSARRRRRLCCVLLKDEWPIYVTLIQLAENLNPVEKRKSRNAAWAQCGVVPDGRKSDDEADSLRDFTMAQWKERFESLTCSGDR
jgi:hypothetical protein